MLLTGSSLGRLETRAEISTLSPQPFQLAKTPRPLVLREPLSVGLGPKSCISVFMFRISGSGLRPEWWLERLTLIRLNVILVCPNQLTVAPGLPGLRMAMVLVAGSIRNWLSLKASPLSSPGSVSNSVVWIRFVCVSVGVAYFRRSTCRKIRAGRT